MKKPWYVMVAILGCALPAGALDLKAITSMPTADNPRFSDKQVWPALAGDEYFLKEKWPKARLLIWAYPGESESRQGPKLLTADPACWIDAATGKPADTIPDMDTDVILPDSDKPYTANTGPTNLLTCRHLTIGRNAELKSWVGGNFAVFGSILVRPTGKLQPSTLTLAGNRDTFIRVDWPADGVLKKAHDERLVTPFDPKADEPQAQPWWNGIIAAYMSHEKEPGKSTEVVGCAGTTDEVGIRSGTFIVGRGSRFVSMGPSTVAVAGKDAKMVLMDGAQCSHGMNQFGPDWNVAEGAQVTGGSPDRPLRRDAFLGIGYRNWMNLPIDKLPDDKTEIPVLPGGAKAYYGYGEYNAVMNGDLIGHPAPGGNARLVVCWQRMSGGGAGAWGRHDEAMKSVFPRILPKITVWFSGTAKLENVRFDDLHRGGIVAPSMDVFRKWKNISFGDACLSEDPNELVRGYEAEIATMKNAGPMSILEPKAKYTTK